jgi:hypothetical protein
MIPIEFDARDIEWKSDPIPIQEIVKAYYKALERRCEELRRELCEDEK